MTRPTSTSSMARSSHRRRSSGLSDLVLAEWTKLASLRSTWGSVALILVAAVGFSVYAAEADRSNWATYSAERRELFNAVRDAFPLQAYAFVMLASASIGAIAIVGECSTGLIRTTFAAVPARGSVMAAKVVVLSVVLTATGAVAAGAGFAVSSWILSGVDANVAVGDPGVLRGIVASALLPTVCGLVGLGLGVVIRHTAATIVTAVTVLLLLPTAFDESRAWKAAALHALPEGAWARLVEPTADQLLYTAYPAGIGASWLVYAAWSVASALVACVVVRHRDVG